MYYNIINIQKLYLWLVFLFIAAREETKVYIYIDKILVYDTNDAPEEHVNLLCRWPPCVHMVGFFSDI